ncbi:hypothetical protein [Lactobacillus amylovorus]|uniref:hypothetical protein n=1 Tax=Lactobacillus amylovorus TaxID=1604 RepID=UPI00232D5E18|nr:hypothetical protein [Lactobacillus amylovorus]
MRSTPTNEAKPANVRAIKPNAAASDYFSPVCGKVFTLVPFIVSPLAPTVVLSTKPAGFPLV